MTPFGDKNVHYGITYYKIMIKGHKRFKKSLKSDNSIISIIYNSPFVAKADKIQKAQIKE